MTLPQFGITLLVGIAIGKGITSYQSWRTLVENAKYTTLTSTDPAITLESLTRGHLVMSMCCFIFAAAGLLLLLTLLKD